MELSLHLISNIVLFIVCISMGTMFLALPIPQKNGLKNYKISLRVLASSYYFLAILTLAILYFKLPDNARELFTFTSITISSFQAFLFANALISLFNPKYVTKRYLIFQLVPFLLISILFGTFSRYYGNPVIARFNEIGMYINNPTLWVRILFLVLYGIQLVAYTLIYFNQEKKYRIQAMNYFSDDVWLKLSWVRVAFISALMIGTISLISYGFSQKWDWVFTLIYSIFYFGFSLEYIKYQKIYKIVGPALVSSSIELSESNKKTRKKIEWLYLRQQIIDNQYFLEAGINIEDIAQRLKIGRTTLSSSINREEGVNFNTWINTLRIEKAKEMLLGNPEEPVSNISEKVGYSEQANFSRQFRQITGYAPTLWRQQQKVNV